MLEEGIRIIGVVEREPSGSFFFFFGVLISVCPLLISPGMRQGMRQEIS